MTATKRFRIWLPFRHRGPVARGQALVEFALILPLLALLLLLAIDFGRVFFGWVALDNATRIAANQAAFDPLTWVAPVNVTKEQTYRQMVLNDMQAINCQPIGGGAWTLAKIPDPVFKNKTGTLDPHEIGDYAEVSLRCGFTFLTPLVGNIMGNPMTISARSEFAIRGGKINGVPVATAIPVTPSPSPTPTPTATPSPTPVPCIAPQLIGLTVSQGRTAWGPSGAGFKGVFTVYKFGSSPPTNAPNNWKLVAPFSHVSGQPYACTDGAVEYAVKP